MSAVARARRSKVRVAVQRTVLSAILVGGAVLLADCGTPHAVGSAELRSYQRLADTLAREVGGGGLQREAADYLAWAGHHKPVRSCMAAKGFRYRTKFISGAEGFKAHGPSGSAWLMELHLRIVSEQARGHVVSSRRENAKTRPLEPGAGEAGKDYQAAEAGKDYQAALVPCQAQAGSTDDVPVPAGMEKLRSALSSVTFPVDEEVGEPGEYADCMMDRGVDVTREPDVDGFAATYIHLTHFVPSPSKSLCRVRSRARHGRGS